MTSERHYYKHAETGIVSEITDTAAAVFGDRLVRVEDPNAQSEEPTPRRTRKKDVDETTDSPKEGNE